MTRKRSLAVIAGCVVVLAAVMVLAVVLNRREARDFAEHGTRAAARVERKYTWAESIGKTDEVHYCLAVGLAGRSLSSCDRGIDQIYDRTQAGDTIRIIYAGDDVMLADWADGKLTSF